MLCSMLHDSSIYATIFAMLIVSDVVSSNSNIDFKLKRIGYRKNMSQNSSTEVCDQECFKSFLSIYPSNLFRIL